MKFYIIIPAHNEQDNIASTLDSLVNQTMPPKKIVVVNDNSTDNTAEVVEVFSKKYPFISLVQNISSEKHLPGTKIINAFYKGYETLDEDYDVICKYDADLIFPNNYLEQLAYHFNNTDALGMVSGVCYIQKDNEWTLENLTRKDHIRGALKAYTKGCFQDIGGIKPTIGWDTVDELLAQYSNWDIFVDTSLRVKHLKPTGLSYSKDSKYLQGEAFYKMRYGFVLTLITAIKMASKKRKTALILDYMKGYTKAKHKGLDYIVTKDEGKFIRRLRWKGIWNKLT